MGQLDLALHRLDRYLQELPPLSRSARQLDRSNPELAQNIVRLEPQSLDDLKAWIGIPNDAIDHAKSAVQMRPVEQSALPAQPFRFAELSDAEQASVEALAHNLLFGYADPGQLSSGPAAHVVAHLLETNRELVLLAGQDLVVENGETYPITADTCAFNSITLHGTGTIALQCDCKLITDSLTYVAD